MPIDLPPNLQNIAAPLVRAAENMPSNPNSQRDRQIKDAGQDTRNALDRERSRSAEKRTKK